MSPPRIGDCLDWMELSETESFGIVLLEAELFGSEMKVFDFAAY